jgi:hypothetical protein
LNAAASKSSNHNIWNVDGTTGELNPTNKHQEVSKLKEEDQKRLDIPEVPTAYIAPSLLASFVKWYFLGSAMGRCGPVVLLLQSSHVQKDEFIKIEVPGLSLSLSTKSVSTKSGSEG